MKLQLKSNASVLVALAFCAPRAKALPSFGTKIPNGENVPCPPSSPGCSTSGLCFGLGHLSCGGFQPEDKTIDATTGAASIALNPFGDDWRASGFVWTKELCELDSDGDGFTNGEELGDPNCVWDTNSIMPELNSVEGFVPSHPGNNDSVPTIPETATVVSVDEPENEPDPDPTGDTTDEDPYAVYYNPGETRGSFDMIMKPYPIPVETTTYVDFIFEVPEDLPDIVHIVFGEVINTQPDHLHHFVINGCTEAIDKDQEGLPQPDTPMDCTRNVGGWAPGSDVFGRPDLESGVIFGRSTGIVALALNVHYTDGVYEDAEAKTLKIAEDGIRVHYTTDFRPKTAMVKHLSWIAFGPPQLTVPPNESRYFVSRTCNVRTSCKDANEDQLAFVAQYMGVEAPAGFIADDTLSCASISAFCFLDGELGARIQKLCPVTCGLCDDTTSDGKLRNPEHYVVTAINYHAHLLGSEMYTTLLRPKLPIEDSSLIEKRSSIEAAMEAKDLKSREYFFYDDQASIPMDYDIVETNTNDAEREMIRGVQIKDGDKIQVTCVYDSTDRTDPTVFGLSTYDEMCITGVLVTFETPKYLLAGESPDVAIATDMDLRLFTCEVDNENHSSDIYQGFLNSTEDGRNIWFEHPIEATDMCTFPIGDYVFRDNIMTMQARNCPKDDDSTVGLNICDGFTLSPSDNVEFLEQAIAGYHCAGGKLGFTDSNENPELNEETCLGEAGGSAYVAYTCADIQLWMASEEAAGIETSTLEFLRTTWWRPKCCSLGEDSGDGEYIESEDDTEDEALSGTTMAEEGILSSSTASSVVPCSIHTFSMASVVITVLAAVVV